MSEEKKAQEEAAEVDQTIHTREDSDETALPGSAIKTSMLSMDDEAEPMQARDPRPNTAMLTLGWRIVFRIGDQKKTLPISEKIVIGRAVDSDANKNEISFDLTPHGAYHFGVSRRHAQMTLKDGYLYLEDFGSTNGTRINGFQLTANQKYRLRDGDEIEFARLRTTIQFKGPDQP